MKGLNLVNAGWPDGRRRRHPTGLAVRPLKRPKSALPWALLAATLLFFLTPQQASALFHRMHIDEVMAGAGGDSSIQFVELRMEASGQNQIVNHTIQFYNASGAQTGTFTFSGNVTNAANGASILIGTTAFDSASSVTPDFFMSSDVVAPDGRVCFENIDCVAYGNYTGSNTGYGSAASALPTSGNSSLKRSTNTNNNANDFALGTPAPRNNAGQTGTVTSPLAAPTGLTAVDHPADQGGVIDLSWTTSGGGSVTEQRLYRGTTSGSHPTLVTTFNDNSTSAYTDTDRTNGIIYYYVVRASDGSSEGSDSNEVSAAPVDNLAPQPPTVLTAADTPGDQGGVIDLTWTPSTSTDVTEQRLYRGTTSGSQPTLVATSTTSTGAYTDTGLTNGVAYYYVVRAFDGANESGNSNEDFATPLDNLVPAEPTGLRYLQKVCKQSGGVPSL